MSLNPRNVSFLETLHGRLTGISTRRRVYDRFDSGMATIRLKAKNVSARVYGSLGGTQDMQENGHYS